LLVGFWRIFGGNRGWWWGIGWWWCRGSRRFEFFNYFFTGGFDGCDEVDAGLEVGGFVGVVGGGVGYVDVEIAGVDVGGWCSNFERFCI